MKLQRSISRRIGGREYVKHQLVIPNNIIARVGWSLGDHIEARINTKGILLYKTDSRQVGERINYEQFKMAISRALTVAPEGCTWSTLRSRAGLHQVTPSPIWVRRLEQENLLERVRSRSTSQVVWRLPHGDSCSAVMSTLNGWAQRNARRNLGEEESIRSKDKR